MGFTVQCEYQADGTKTVNSDWEESYEEKISDVQICTHHIEGDISKYPVMDGNIPKGYFSESELTIMSYTGKWEYSRQCNDGITTINVVYACAELKKITVISDS